MQQHYTLTRTFLDDAHYTTITVSDYDAINCAHLLASGFNTISRNFTGDFVLGVVNTKAGTVQYDGKIEKIDRPDPQHEDLESLALETVPIGPECFASTSGSLLCWRGRNYIPQDEYEAHMRARNVEISELVQERANANAAARAEMIEYVKGAYAKLGRLDAAGERDDLQGRMRGMLDVLAKFLVVTGEADADERHAAALRVCDIPEGNYLYDEQ